MSQTTLTLAGAQDTFEVMIAVRDGHLHVSGRFQWSRLFFSMPVQM